MRLKHLESITLNFSTGKSFEFFKDKKGRWELAETKVPKAYWGLDIRVTDAPLKRKPIMLKLDLFKPRSIV